MLHVTGPIIIIHKSPMMFHSFEGGNESIKVLGLIIIINGNDKATTTRNKTKQNESMDFKKSIGIALKLLHNYKFLHSAYLVCNNR